MIQDARVYSMMVEHDRVHHYLKSWFERFMVSPGWRFLQIIIWEILAMYVWISRVANSHYRMTPSSILLVNASEPWGLLIMLAPDCHMKNWKLRSHLAVGGLKTLISNYDFQVMISVQRPSQPPSKNFSLIQKYSGGAWQQQNHQYCIVFSSLYSELGTPTP